MAVTPANQDFATSEPLKMAREVDPEGEWQLFNIKTDLLNDFFFLIGGGKGLQSAFQNCSFNDWFGPCTCTV